MTELKAYFDSSLLRETLGCFTTGVVVATTRGDSNAPVGLTVNSFSSVSLDPPLILWSIALNAPSLGAFREHSGFSINILSEKQKSVGMQFAQAADDKFKGVDWYSGYAQTPVISNALAVLQCKTYKRYEGGDHEIYIGEVKQIHFTDKKPLVFNRGRFVELADSDT